MCYLDHDWALIEQIDYKFSHSPSTESKVGPWKAKKTVLDLTSIITFGSSNLLNSDLIIFPLSLILAMPPIWSEREYANILCGQPWWHVLVIAAARRLKQWDRKHEASLGIMWNSIAHAKQNNRLYLCAHFCVWDFFCLSRLKSWVFIICITDLMVWAAGPKI